MFYSVGMGKIVGLFIYASYLHYIIFFITRAFVLPWAFYNVAVCCFGKDFQQVLLLAKYDALF